MRSVFVCLFLIMWATLPVGAQSLHETWMQVQQGLTDPPMADLDVRIKAMEEAAEGVRVARLTPFAAALVEWARDNPGETGETVLKAAQVFDPKLPSAFFLGARWNWEKGSYFAAMGSYLAGLWAMLRFEGSERVLFSAAGMCAMLALALSILMTTIVQTALHIRRLSHDAVELGGMLFNRYNAIVFAIVIVLLPLFAGFGPIWLFAYLFAMSWIYMSMPARVFSMVSLLILALVPVGLEFWRGQALRTTPLTMRVTRMLEERQVGFSTLREFAELEAGLSDNPQYHLIYGELLRMHGHPERARGQFRTAAVLGLRSADAYVFLGSLSMENGEISQAIQEYNKALEVDSKEVLAYVNLSSAFDQSNRFVEGDGAREKAQEIAGRRSGAMGIAGRDSRIRFPLIGRDDVERLVRSFSPEVRRTVGLHTPDIKALGGLLTPFSMAMWVNFLLGIGVLVARSKMMWVSSACTRCGKVFCPRCKIATESMSYCSQCISVFLKRDLVSIDQQTVKLNQIRRWEALTKMVRRVVGVLMPGSHYVFAGNVIGGFFLASAVWLLVVAGLVWLPMFFPSAEPLASVLPLQVVILILVIVLWTQSVIMAWYRR